MVRKLLLIAPATSYRVEAFVRASRRLGVELTVGCDVPAAHERHGVRTIKVDLSDSERGAEDCLNGGHHRYDGVLGTDEASAVVAAHVARRLGRSMNDPDGVLATRDKRRMRQRLAHAGVPQPGWRVLEPHADVGAFAEIAGYPCVVKPPMLTGSQGVIRADQPAELVSAVSRVRRILEHHPSGWSKNPDFHRLLAEDFVDGPEIAVEALLDSGRVVWSTVFDKPDELAGPFFEETLYVTPSRHAPEALHRARNVVELAARALGLVQGPIHAELRLAARGPALIEIAARSIGGLCSRTLELAADNLEELLIRHAVDLSGADVGFPSGERRAAGVMMIPIAKNGVLRGVEGVDAALGVPGIDSVEITTRLGEAVRKLPEGSSYLGFVFAHAGTPDEVEAALREAHAKLRFAWAPLLPLG